MQPTFFNRRALLAVASALAVSLLVPAAFAQADRTIRFVLPNATGSGVDTITRSAQPALAKALGHSVIVDNQPGAGGIVEVQGTAETVAFSQESFDQLMALAKKGIAELIELQKLTVA